MSRTRSWIVLAALAGAVLFSGTAAPLHDIEALHGHENCGTPDGRPVITHECHDEDSCLTCRLAHLPLSNASDVPAALPDAGATWAPADAGAAPDLAGRPLLSPARAPPSVAA